MQKHQPFNISIKRLENILTMGCAAQYSDEAHVTMMFKLRKNGKFRFLTKVFLNLTLQHTEL